MWSRQIGGKSAVERRSGIIGFLVRGEDGDQVMMWPGDNPPSPLSPLTPRDNHFLLKANLSRRIERMTWNFLLHRRGLFVCESFIWTHIDRESGSGFRRPVNGPYWPWGLFIHSEWDPPSPQPPPPPGWIWISFWKTPVWTHAAN